MREIEILFFCVLYTDIYRQHIYMCMHILHMHMCMTSKCTVDESSTLLPTPCPTSFRPLRLVRLPPR